jgi:hypothetical protein
LEQIEHVIRTMPADKDIERRNRALVAFTLLTGARDSAIASMKLKHVDLITNSVNQDGREVKTKFSKTFNIFFFPAHSFRNTLVQLGQDICKTPEQFKAWSQNLGHEKVLTTFLSYGEVACQRQGEIIRDLAMPQMAVPTGADEIAEAVYKKLRLSGMDV